MSIINSINNAAEKLDATFEKEEARRARKKALRRKYRGDVSELTIWRYQMAAMIIGIFVLIVLCACIIAG